MTEENRSINLARLESKEHFITAATWNGIYGTSYEIGVREKHGTGRFDLIQGNWTEAGVLKAAQTVVLMLDADFSLGQIIEVLNP